MAEVQAYARQRVEAVASANVTIRDGRLWGPDGKVIAFASRSGRRKTAANPPTALPSISPT